MNYLVIDLEMCKVPRNYRCNEYKYALETIQIGAVLLDEEFNRIGTINQYVHPEYGVIDHFITDLTGIRGSHVKHAPLLKETLLHMIDWIGDREYKIYAWSDSDYNQFVHEITSKGIKDDRIDAFMKEENWVDYQEVFTNRYELPQKISLKEALERADIQAEGRLHDGLDDAINTGYLIEKLEMNPEFQLSSYEGYAMSEQPLSFTMGDLFAGLKLQLA